jgi:membrane-bound serine protease (ClpP class)
VDVFVFVALLGVALLLAELLLPTGGFLAFLGACGLVAGGILALTADSDSTASDVAGPALITLGVLSLASFYFVTRKVLAAHREVPVHTGGHEELVGRAAEARTALDPDGQVWIEGALWHARLRGSNGRIEPGDRVIVESIDGLTLEVSRAAPTEEGAGG